MVKNSEIAEISLDGGALCLDFINTVHNRKDDPLPDFLHHSMDLTAWAYKVGLIDSKREKLLDSVAQNNLKKAEVTFKSALLLRELLYRIFYAITHNKKVGTDDLNSFNDHLRLCLSRVQLTEEKKSFNASLNLSENEFEQVTAPVVRDAYTLLLSDKLSRVKECPSCGWLFLDTTKNGKRRWCSMKSCGSNVKALEWYYRQKE